MNARCTRRSGLGKHSSSADGRLIQALRASIPHVMRQNGVINADEWRGLENMKPIGGRAGTLYWKPLNMGDADSEDAIEPPAAAPTGNEDENEEKSLRAVK